MSRLTEGSAVTRWLTLGLRLAAILVLPARVAGEAYRVGEGARSLDPAWVTIQLLVFSIESDGQEIELRLGLRNIGTETLEAVPGVALEQARLERALTGESMDLLGTTVPTLEGAEWKPQSVLPASLRFRVSEAMRGTGLSGSLTLHLPPFLPLSFGIEEEQRFEPVDTRAVDQTFKGSAVLRPNAGPLAQFPISLDRVSASDEHWRLDLNSRNASRMPLQWLGDLDASALRLLTGEAELLVPQRVEGVLAQGLGPREEVWQPGEPQYGRVVFARPHAHAATSLTLLMPGYRPLVLRQHPDGGYAVVVTEDGEEQDEGAEAVAEFQKEETRFRSIAAFWRDQAARLMKRNQAAFLDRFDAGPARERIAESLAGWVRVPVTWVDFHLPPSQLLVGDELSCLEVLVEMRCTLAGLPRENEFVCRWRCDLRRESPDSEWRVTQWRLDGRRPFWEVGFTEFLSTERFLVFHQLAVEEGEARARAAARQLELGWERLRKSALPLGNRYVAFVIPRKEDFFELTGRDPGTFSGAMSAAYAKRGKEVRAVNQALYLNESHFGTLQRFWGGRDRQRTIEHELVHLALADWSRPWTPAWLVEGTAMAYAGQMDRTARAHLKQFLPRGEVLSHLSTLPLLGQGAKEPREVLVQYQYSGAVVEWMRQQFGEQALLQYYRAFREAPPESWLADPGAGVTPGTESEARRTGRRQLAERLLAEHLNGWRLEQLDEAVLRSLRD